MKGRQVLFDQSSAAVKFHLKALLFEDSELMLHPVQTLFFVTSGDLFKLLNKELWS
jgi:predicted ATP-dependent endonuclease of OLD family